LLALGLAGSMHPDPTTAAEYTVDSAHTVVTFEVRRFGFLNQSGRFEGVTGRAAVDDRSQAAEFDLVIDAASVRASNGALTRIMRSDDFFDVARYPTILYSGQQVTFSNGALARIDGNLTLHGVTGPLTLVVTGFDCASPSLLVDMRCVISASGTIRRSRFDMNNLSLLVADRVKLVVRAELVATGERASTLVSP